MNTSFAALNRNDRGSVLVTTVLLLAIAGIALGSMLTAQITFSRNGDATHRFDIATYLANAGVDAAVVRLNAESDGNIAYDESQHYFSQTNQFDASDWGFQTTLSVTTNYHNLVTSIGRFRGVTVQVQSEVTLGQGSRNLHALYAHALFAGNSSHTNYTLEVGGTGTGADFVKGDVYSGSNVTVSGDAKLRLPEILVDTNGDHIAGIGELWTNAFATQTFTNGLTASAFTAYSNSMAPYMSKVYNNGHYDYGEAFRDTIGNGQYDLGEPFTDLNGNGIRDVGDDFIDKNSNGVYDVGETVVDHGNGRYDAGEEWVEDSTHKIGTTKVRVNGRWDGVGGYWKSTSGVWSWISNSTTKAWAAEVYEDVGDGVYQPAEPYEDQNGVYDPGEAYIDDRNSVYDYGTTAPGTVSGMPTPGPGQVANNGNNDVIDPPDLVHMYYSVSKTASQPIDALSRWGNDVTVNATAYGSAIAIADASRPQHIFIRNPPVGTSGSVSSGGKTIYKRSYTTITNSSGQRVDDYFFEDPADASYNTTVSAGAIDGIAETAPMYITVGADANSKLYYVDGNVYIHSPQVKSFRFRNPGTRITIVANGNITISDEFYYNADYPAGLTYATLDSTVVKNPSDVLCLIALKNANCPANSGNILIGDQQFGTGGSIHAMLYAENDFVDNNLNTVDQAFISVFGNMTAGNRIRLNRTSGSGLYRTRLDVTLDERIRNGEVIIPGVPHPIGSQRSIFLDTAWHKMPGTWSSWSRLQ